MADWQIIPGGDTEAPQASPEVQQIVRSRTPEQQREAGLPIEIRPSSRDAVVQFWVNKGAPEHVAEGIADRVGSESSFRPDVPGDSGTSGGLYQHHADRLARLKEYAAKQGKPWTDPSVQNEFAFSETQGGDAIASKHWQDIVAAPNRQTAAYLWDKYFERSAGGVGGGGGWNVVAGGDKVRLSDEAVSEAAKHGKTAFSADPQDILALLPSTEEGEGGERKRSSLSKAMARGEAIQDLPEISGEMQPDGSLKINSYDGRHRLQELADAGYTKVPVVIQGAKGEPKSVVGMSGVALPFSSFTPAVEKPPDTAMQHILGGIGRAGMEAARLGGEALGQTAGAVAGVPLGVAQAVEGVSQLAAHVAAAAGLPGAQTAAGMTDTAAQGINSAINALPEGRMGASVGNIGASLAVPTNWLAAVPRMARPLAAAGLGVAAGAAQPVVPSQPGPVTDYWQQQAQRAPMNALVGGAVPAAAEGVNLLRAAAGRVVRPSDATRAMSRLLGEDTRHLTPAVMEGVRQRTSRVFQQIEQAHDLPVSNAMLNEIGNIERDVETAPEARSLVRSVVDAIVARIDQNGNIPGKKAAEIWHENGPVDRLIEAANPTVRSYGFRLQAITRDAFQNSLSPNEAQLYSDARNTWRDLKIAEKVLSRRPGRTQLPPSELNVAIGQRFRRGASQTNVPPVLDLGRAIGQTWVPEAASLPRQIAGRITRDLIGGAVGGLLGSAGGPFGSAAGAGVGSYIADRIGQLRMPNRNALTALRSPPSPTVTNNLAMMGRFAPPAAAAMSMPSGPMAPLRVQP